MFTQNYLTMKCFLFFLPLLLLFAACKKDKPLPVYPVPTDEKEIPPTIHPNGYFPAWPGSYWTYMRPDSTLYTTTVHPEYQLFFDYYSASTVVDSSTARYLPVYQGQFVQGYAFVSHSGGYGGYGDNTYFFPGDDCYTGQFFNVHSQYGFTEQGWVMARDTSMEIRGLLYDSIVVIKYYVDPDHPIRKRYYAYGVGIVREDIYPEYGPDSAQWIISGELVNHFINH